MVGKEKREPLLPVSERQNENIVSSIFAKISGANIARWWFARKWSGLFLVGTWLTILFLAPFDTSDFTWKSWWALGLTGTAMFFLINDQPPDLVLLSVTVLLRLSSVTTDEQAFSGFHSDGILAIGALFVVAKSLETSGAIEWLMSYFLFRTKSTGALDPHDKRISIERWAQTSRAHRRQSGRSCSCVFPWRWSQASSTTRPWSP